MEFGLLGGPTWWFLAGLLGFLVLATVVAAMFGGFLLRLLAIRFHWEMPKFVYNDDVH